MRKGISRRGFLQGVGAGAGTVALSQAFPFLQGCDPAATLLYGQELVGNVTGRTSIVRLVAGDACQPSTRFRLLYDTVPRSHPAAYAFQTPELSGYQAHDPINFQLDALLPNQRYFYRTAHNEGSQWLYRGEHHFWTQRPPGQTFRFCIVADTHIAPNLTTSSRRGQVFANVLADDPDFLISLGDEAFVAYQTAKMYPWPDRDQLFSAFKNLRGYLDLACHSMSFLPVNGNHEGLFGWAAGTPQYTDILDAKLAYFPIPGRSTYPQGGDDLGRYGAFTWGDALFIWLDVVGFCEVDPFLQGSSSYYILGPAQRTFLESTLAASNSAWKFVFAHHLFGGNEGCEIGYGRGNANAAGLYAQAEIQAWMEDYGAQAFFYGHDHVFAVSEANGVNYICAGNAGSGAPWAESLEACYEPYTLYSLREGKSPFGHVRVDVSPLQTTVSYVEASATDAAANQVINHSYTINV